MKKLQLAIMAVSLAGAMSAQASLVVNGGFETGSFAGWSLIGNPGFRTVVSSPVHSGSFAGSFGAIGSLGGIAQSLPTVASQTYTFDFWLRNSGGTPSEAVVSWNGSAVLHLLNPGSFGYTHFSYTTTATGASTPIKFEFRQDPSFFQLDDISVTAVPEPSTYIAGALMLLPFGLQGMRHLRSRKPAA